MPNHFVTTIPKPQRVLASRTSRTVTSHHLLTFELRYWMAARGDELNHSSQTTERDLFKVEMQQVNPEYSWCLS
jgi:hypothetical protein